MRVTLLGFVAACLLVLPSGQSDLDTSVTVIRPPQRAIAGPRLDRASWYGEWHQGKTTANGEAFNMYDLTAAHKNLPFGTLLRVTDFDTGRSIVVRINDRGPYWPNRSLDLSYAAAKQLGIVDRGLARVRLQVVGRQTEAAQQQHPPAADPKTVG